MAASAGRYAGCLGPGPVITSNVIGPVCSSAGIIQGIPDGRPFQTATPGQHPPHQGLLHAVVIQREEARQLAEETANGPAIDMPKPSRFRILASPAVRLAEPEILYLTPAPVAKCPRADALLRCGK